MPTLFEIIFWGVLCAAIGGVSWGVGYKAGFRDGRKLR